MASASYKSTINPGNEPQVKGIALVAVTDNEGKVTDVQVSYWPSLISQWQTAGVIAYVEAEALAYQGFLADARSVAIAGIPVPDGQKWANEHPDPPQGL